MKLKPEYQDAVINIGFLRQTMIGKFIPTDLYPAIYKKMPHLFQLEPAAVNPKATPKKSDVIHINDPKPANKDNFQAEQD